MFFNHKFDHDKIERYFLTCSPMHFKFTPSGGYISVMISLSGEDVFNTRAKMLTIKVIDTGIGIPVENHEKIFERFFQDDMPKVC